LSSDLEQWNKTLEKGNYIYFNYIKINRKDFKGPEVVILKSEEAALLILKDTIMEINNFCYDDSD
jgi:hypothetical protein